MEDDIGADIAAALSEAKGDTPAPAPEPVLDAAPAPAPEPDKGPSRDDHGRFAARAEAAPQSTDPLAPEPTEPKEVIRPPASWSAQAKADFAALPAHIQQEVLKRETDVSKGFEERASQLKRYEPLEQVIGPHRDRIALAGMDEASYVRSLIAADEMLRGPNRFQALAQIAQGYGIDLRQFAQPGQPGLQPQQAQQSPEYQQLAQTVSHLQQQLAQQQSSAQQAEHARLQAEIDGFSKDHLYFDNVRAEMAALMRTGQVTTLADAYERACWGRPDIRPLLMKEQEDKRRAEAEAQARAKANDAKRAAGSITGSPVSGAAPPPANANASIEDDVRAAFRAASSSV